MVRSLSYHCLHIWMVIHDYAGNIRLLSYFHYFRCNIPSFRRVPVVEAYAMTEASHQMTSNCLPPRQRKAGTVGVAHGGVVVAILDDKGDKVANGVEGEICVKGENVTSGYLNNPKVSRLDSFPAKYSQKYSCDVERCSLCRLVESIEQLTRN